VNDFFFDYGEKELFARKKINEITFYSKESEIKDDSEEERKKIVLNNDHSLRVFKMN